MITVVGQLLDPLGQSFRGHSVDTASVRSRQETPLALTIDHAELAGEVLTLTRTGGSIYAVAVADADPLLELDKPIYYSPTTSTRAADGSDGIILDLALTLRTARVAAQPVTLLPGDVRKPNDHRRWALRGLTAELIACAADELRHRPRNAPIHIRDLEQEKRIERENERRSYSAPSLAARSKHAQPVPPQERPGWRPGMVEWSQAGGRILNVR